MPICEYHICLSDNFILGENIKIDMSNTYDKYDRLSSAKTACSYDRQCIGIYEDMCDKKGPFLLVKSNFMTTVSGTNCIYKKKTYGKKYCFVIKSTIIISGPFAFWLNNLLLLYIRPGIEML